MKKLLVVLLSLGLCLSLYLPAFAEEIETSGTCGENVTWELSDTTLTISGAGAMGSTPWNYLVSTENGTTVKLVANGKKQLEEFTEMLAVENPGIIFDEEEVVCRSK